jgi:hypothetical protein
MKSCRKSGTNHRPGRGKLSVRGSDKLSPTGHPVKEWNASDGLMTPHATLRKDLGSLLTQSQPHSLLLCPNGEPGPGQSSPVQSTSTTESMRLVEESGQKGWLVELHCQKGASPRLRAPWKQSCPIAIKTASGKVTSQLTTPIGRTATWRPAIPFAFGL